LREGDLREMRLEGNERERESSEKVFISTFDDDVMNLFLERALKASDFVSGV